MSYATDSNTTKATSECAGLEKTSSETSVKFAVVLRSRVARCGIAYLEERTSEMFIDGPPTNTESVAKMFWGRDQDAHLSKTAHYKDTLLEQTVHVPSSVVTLTRRNVFQRGHRTAPIIATVAKTRTVSPKENHCINLTPREKFLPGRGNYGSYDRMQQATHCRVCLAKDKQMNTCLYTVCFRK